MARKNSSSGVPPTNLGCRAFSSYTLLDAAYLWQRGSTPLDATRDHPRDVLARAEDILKWCLCFFGSRTSLAEHFDDLVTREQLTDYAAEIGERPVFLFGDVIETPAALGNRKARQPRGSSEPSDRVKDLFERLLKVALLKLVKCHRELRKADTIDVDKLIASVKEDQRMEDYAIRSLIEPICKFVDTPAERHSILSRLFAANKGHGEHFGVERKLVLAAGLYEGVNLYEDVLSQDGSIDIDAVAKAVSNRGAFHFFSTVPKLPRILHS